MKKIIFQILLLVSFSSCSLLFKPYSEETGCLLCKSILNCRSVQNILRLDTLNADFNTSIRIVDMSHTLKMCYQMTSLNNGLIVETYVLYEVPISLNSGLNYKDLIILNINEKKDIVYVKLFATSYSNEIKRTSYVVDLQFKHKDKSSFELIYEKPTLFHSAGSPHKYYEKKHYKMIKHMK